MADKKAKPYHPAWTPGQKFAKAPCKRWSLRPSLSLLAISCVFSAFWVPSLWQVAVRRSHSRPEADRSRYPTSPVLHSVSTDNSASTTRLTIFTILKEMAGGNATHPRENVTAAQATDEWMSLTQTYNSIGSWLSLPDTDVIGFGNSADCAAITAELETVPLPMHRFRCLPVPTFLPDTDVPTYDGIFGMGQSESRSEYVAYANSDIILFDDIMRALDKVESANLETFLLSARRTDVSWPHRILFNEPSWRQELKTRVTRGGKLHQDGGFDIGIWRKGRFPDLPPFLVGRILWDNYILAWFITNPDHHLVDATGVIVAVHQNHGAAGNSHFRTHTEVNRELAAAAPWKRHIKDTGKLADADWTLEPEGGVPLRASAKGACPACKFVRNHNQCLHNLLQAHSHNDTIILATVTAAFLPLALNWRCALERRGLRNFIILTDSTELDAELKRQNVPSYYLDPSSWLPTNVPLESVAHLRGAGPFQNSSLESTLLATTQTKFVVKVLQRGFHVILSDLDTVMLRDVHQHLPGILSASADVVVTEGEAGRLSTSFVFVRATEAAVEWWSQVFFQLKGNAVREIAMGNVPKKTPAPLKPFGEVFDAMLRRANLTWTTWPQSVVAGSRRFFVDKVSQAQGEWPVVVHSGSADSLEAVKERLQNSTLWLLDEDLQCLPFPMPQLPWARALEDGGRVSYVIKVLAMEKPKALARLLESLKRADLGWFKFPIPLDIYVDFPENATADAPPPAWLAARDAARHFRWPYGPKHVIEWPEHQGALGMWTSCWLPKSRSEVAIVLEEEMEVARPFLRWTHSAVKYFYSSEENYDPRLYGLALHPQTHALGRRGANMSDLLEGEPRFYLTQQPSMWGPVLFPGHWSEFLSWLVQHKPGFQPLFSNAASNEGFRERADWSAYFVRFVAERGWYSLYTNFPHRGALAIHHPPPDAPMDAAGTPPGPLLKDVDGPMLNFASSTQAMPLYDFQWNKISEDRSVLEGRGLYADTWNAEVH